MTKPAEKPYPSWPHIPTEPIKGVPGRGGGVNVRVIGFREVGTSTAPVDFSHFKLNKYSVISARNEVEPSFPLEGV